MKRSWHELKRGRPGSRFEQHYRRRHESGSHPLRRVLFLGGGSLVVAAGIFFLPAPGPGFIIIALGGGLLAQESRRAAKALDWCELRLRALLGWGKRQWQRAPVALKSVYVLLALTAGSGAAWLAYRVLF